MCWSQGARLPQVVRVIPGRRCTHEYVSGVWCIFSQDQRIGCILKFSLANAGDMHILFFVMSFRARPGLLRTVPLKWSSAGLEAQMQPPVLRELQQEESKANSPLFVVRLVLLVTT